MASEERLRELEEKYEGYTVYDNGGSKIGKVDDLFVDESDNEEYIGVKMGFFGTKSTLIPTEIIRINESDRTIEVSESKDRVKDAPNFSDDDEVTREYEERIRSHFGLESLGSGSGRGPYGGAAAGASSGTSDRDANDRGHSDQGSSSYESGDRESSAHDTRNDTSGSSGVDTDYGERRDPDAASAGTAGATESQGSGESSSRSEGYTEERGSSEGTGTRYGDTGSSGSTSGTTGTSSSEGSSGATPSTTRQTEETETFQEGGRTKIRRRIIREEVVDADDQGTSS